VIGAASLGLLLLLGAAVLLFRRRRARAAAAAAGLPAELPAAGADVAPGAPPAEIPAGAASPSLEAAIESQLAAREAMQQKLETQARTSLKLAPVITKTAEVLAKHLREKIAKDADVSAQILRTWIRDEEG
jgi:flagellar biosynthesis/type III secretory pathway M-ring protein FliF/YscJ